MPPVPLHKPLQINPLFYLTKPQIKLSLVFLVPHSWAKTVPVGDQLIGFAEVVDQEQELLIVLMR